MHKVLVTGSAGFIGYHLCRLLLSEGVPVVGYDGMTDYYDVRLKQRRHAMLNQTPGFVAVEAMLEDMDRLQATFDEHRPQVIVHLAAQAGVRHSIENPRAYLSANITGSFNVMECARSHGARHLLMASTSSVYGASTDMPFREAGATDTPLTFYAATKKATESLAHSWANIWRVPITMFRFFSVYGPWGRPDMALFKFVAATLKGEPIELYNNGLMERDFTYVDDLVRSIHGLMAEVPEAGVAQSEADSISPVAPFRIVNIGNAAKVRLTDFVDEVEQALGRPMRRTYTGMQQGDVPATWADATLLRDLTGFQPATPVREGVREFVHWYREYYGT
jgi:UDP-glucuronate 4-epimerase